MERSLKIPAQGLLPLAVLRKDLSKEMEEAESFDEIFRVVKRAVKDVIGTSRAGLMLVLADLPLQVLAFHTIGTNTIVANKRVLEYVRANSRNANEFKSYVFVVLLHEYLHSLGISDELRVRHLTKEIVRECLGENHVAYRIATEPLDNVFPGVTSLGAGYNRYNFEIVKEFDKENVTYIY